MMLERSISTRLFWTILLPLLAVGTWFSWQLYCHDISCKAQHDRWFAARYDASVPVFLTPQNAQAVLSNLENDAQRDAIGNLLEKFAAQTPPPVTRAKTCAVVGNSDNLLDSGYGPIIDAHEVILRMNNAPVEKFERDVGTRTTYHVIHSYFGGIRPYGADVINVLITENINVPYQRTLIARGDKGFDDTFYRYLLALSDRIQPEITFPGPERKPTDMPKNIARYAEKLLLVHPEFIYYINDRWFTRDKRPLNLPSTGFKAVILALHLCEHIDLFGFGAANQESRWAHYYDEEKSRRAAGHLPDFQEQFLDELERRGFVRRFRGVAHAPQ